jgi:ribonuclease-3
MTLKNTQATYNFKNNDVKYHILNEKNQYITKRFIESVLSQYNCNHVVKNLDLFQLAMIHISYLEKTSYTDKTLKMIQDTKPIDDGIDVNKIIPLQKDCYGRLEFFGDAVIKNILSNYLYYRYPNEGEGFLTKLRTKIEKSSSLSNLCQIINLHKYAIIARNIEQTNGRITNTKCTEDIFEAFIGALNIDAGFDKTYQFLIDLIENTMDFAEMIDTNDNYKEILMHYFQKQRMGDPKYITTEKDKNYYTYMKIPSLNIEASSVNKIKVDSEQLCAKQILEKINQNNNNLIDYFGELN